MAVGDVVNGLTSVATTAYLDIVPGAGVEWVIHNIYWGGAVECYFYDGTNEVKFDVDTMFGGRIGAVFHCTSARRIRIKNVSAGSIFIGYDGIQTK